MSTQTNIHTHPGRQDEVTTQVDVANGLDWIRFEIELDHSNAVQVFFHMERDPYSSDLDRYDNSIEIFAEQLRKAADQLARYAEARIAERRNEQAADQHATDKINA